MGLLLLATTINYMDRVTLSNAAVNVSADLGLTNTQYGNLELAFGWAFACGSLVFGIMADRWSVYVLYPAILSAWSLMGIASAWSQGFTELLVCRTLLGFFEAGHWPCALKTTFALLDKKERTMGNSILQSGASIGAIITPQIMKSMMTEEPSSWRNTFVVIGAIGFVWVVLWFVSMRPRDIVSTTMGRAKLSRSRLWSILWSRRFWAVALFITGAQTVWHIYRVWLVKFLQTGRGYSQTEALNFTSIYYIATDVGCLLAGAITLWLTRSYGTPAHLSQRTVSFAACLLTSTGIFIPFLDQSWQLLVTLLLVGAGAMALFPCYYSFVQELSGDHVGRLTGILGMWVWAVTSPLQSVFGIVADSTQRYDVGLAIAGLCPWIGVLSMKFLWTKDSPRDIASTQE
jgi:ACS family hexuronate transporter-like MFS transporter